MKQRETRPVRAAPPIHLMMVRQAVSLVVFLPFCCAYIFPLPYFSCRSGKFVLLQGELGLLFGKFGLLGVRDELGGGGGGSRR